MACYLVNRSSTTVLVNKTPYEAWAGKGPLLHISDTLGVDSFVKIPKENKSKLDNKSVM